VHAEGQRPSQPVSNQLNVWLQVYDFVFALSDDDDLLQALQVSQLLSMEMSTEYRRPLSLTVSQNEQLM
jgi:hypothetical protein